MTKTIDLTESGSNRRLTIVASNILHFEPLTYNDGRNVTVITFVNNDTIHVLETVAQVKKLLSDK